MASQCSAVVTQISADGLFATAQITGGRSDFQGQTVSLTGDRRHNVERFSSRKTKFGNKTNPGFDGVEEGDEVLVCADKNGSMILSSTKWGAIPKKPYRGTRRGSKNRSAGLGTAG